MGEEGLKFTGGALAPLCWPDAKWLGGWDLDVDITEHHLRHSCPDCVRLYKDALDAGKGDER